MRKTRCSVVAVTAALAAVCFGLSSPADADTFTMDFTGVGTSSYGTYSEDGFTLFAEDGGSEHFHGLGDSAGFYSNDGTPQRMDFGGLLFSLDSIDLSDAFGDGLSGDVTFTSSTGGVLLVPGGSASGTYLFGPVFDDITFFRMEIAAPPSGENFAGFDNIVTSTGTIPAPAALPAGLALLGAMGVFGRGRRRLA